MMLYSFQWKRVALILSKAIPCSGILEMVPHHLKDISSVLITCFYSPLFSPVLLVSQGCPNKVLQTQWPKNSNLLSASYGSQTSESQCLQSYALSEGSRGEFFLSSSQFLVVAGSPWHSLAGRCITSISASTVCHKVFSGLCVSVSKSSFYPSLFLQGYTGHWVGAHLNLAQSHVLTRLYLQIPSSI